MNEVGVIYARLSREDENKNIDNQIQGLLTYAKEHSINIIKVYSDDGFTGGNLNRPGFLELLNDAKRHLFNTILIKDLSRIGRVMHQVGYLIEDVFPKNNIRVISVGDSYDSKLHQGELITIKNFLNAYYLKDFKRKCHNALLYRANTIHLNYYPKYGYYFDCNKKEQVDPYASKIVQLIFSFASSGKTTTEIASILNEKKVLTRSKYEVEVLGLKPLHKHSTSAWKRENIWEIIKDYEYVGHSLNLIKNDSPILLKNTHHAIITEETFKLANEKLKKRKRNNNVISKILIDENTGKKLSYVVTKSKGKDNYYYSRISKYSIREKALQDFLFNECLKIIENYVKNEQIMKEIYLNKILHFDSLNLLDLKKQKERLNLKYENLIKQYLNKQINKGLYDQKSKEIFNQIINIENYINNDALKNDLINFTNKFINFLNKFKSIIEKSQLIQKMITKVLINENEKTIIINYSFIDFKK